MKAFSFAGYNIIIIMYRTFDVAIWGSSGDVSIPIIAR